MKKRVIFSIFAGIFVIGCMLGLNFNYDSKVEMDNNTMAYTSSSTFRMDSLAIASMLNFYFERATNEIKEGIYYFTLDGYFGEILLNLMEGEEYNLYDGKSDVFANQLIENENVETGFYYVIGNKTCENNQTSFIRVSKTLDNKYDYKFCLTTKDNRYIYANYSDIQDDNFEVIEINNNQNNTINIDKFTKNADFIRGMYVVAMIIVLLGFSVGIVANWKLFKKANKPGWASLVPIYQNYVLYEIIFGNGWYFLIYVFGFLIPFVGLIISIVTSYKLGKVFGKSTGFIIGLIFLGPIFKLILAFDKSQYIGYIQNNSNNNLNNVVYPNNIPNQYNNMNSVGATTNNYNDLIANNNQQMTIAGNEVTSNQQVSNIKNVIHDGYNPEQNDGFYCSKCGTKLLKTTIVCPRCGARYE